MANEDDLDLDVEPSAAAPKSKSKLLIIIGLVVVFLAISATATLALTSLLAGEEEVAEDSSGKKADNKKQEKKAKSKEPLNYVSLDPAFVVNFSGDADVRFLQIAVEAGTRDPDVVEQIKEHRPAIRNSLVMLFSSQDPAVLDTREGKETLRNQALGEIQKVLKSETGNNGVENVFFTSFVMQ